MADKPKYDHPTVFNYLHDYGVDLRKRRIFFHHCMATTTDETPGTHGTEYIIRNLLYLDKSQGDVELWINNPGGYLEEMWGIIDVMESCENLVHTIGYGNISSAGCLLLASGTGTRYATRHASFMWHSGTTDISSDMHWPDARDRMQWEIRENERWVECMANKTKPKDSNNRAIRTKKGKIEYWSDYVNRGGELWYDANQMISHGVVDKMWGTGNEKY